MKWLKSLDEDQKNNIFVFVIIALVLFFVAFTRGCFSADLKKVNSVQTADVKTDLVKNYTMGSTEYRLALFLNDSSQAIEQKKGNWFEFDHINFENGKSTLTEDSKLQIKNIAQVMKQFPQATFKIGGYTDNTGAEAVNLKISEERAQSVLHQLIQQGVTSQQLTGAEGYGSQHPVADNSTIEGRTKNRRIAIRVKSK